MSEKQPLDKAEEAMNEIQAIAKKYGLSSVIILADEVAGTFGFEISEEHSDKRLVIKGLSAITEFMHQFLQDEYQKHSPKGFAKGRLGKPKGS